MDFEISKITINNDEIPAMPAKRSDITVSATCTNDVSASWNTETWSLDLSNFSKKTSCEIKITATSDSVVEEIKGETEKTAAEEAAKEIIDGGSSNEGSSSGTIIDNPATGAFLNIFLILAIIGAAAFIIVRAKKKNKFFRI